MGVMWESKQKYELEFDDHVSIKFERQKSASTFHGIIKTDPSCAGGYFLIWGAPGDPNVPTVDEGPFRGRFYLWSLLEVKESGGIVEFDLPVEFYNAPFWVQVELGPPWPEWYAGFAGNLYLFPRHEGM